jgi:plastocyanin
MTTTRGSIELPSSINTMTTTNSTGNIPGGVAVGGGNLTVAINQFIPSAMEIRPGQNVTFYAPSGSTELHNVVLDLTNGSAISSIELAFILPSGFSAEALELAPPDNYGEPIIQNMSDGRQAIVALNKVLFHPSTINQQGEATFLHEQELIQQMQQGAQQGSAIPPPLSANYTMQGTEVIVSSGLVLDVMGFAPLGQGAVEEQQQQLESTPQGIDEYIPPAYPILSNFTITFNEPGAYPFFCAFHPGMAGFINVVGEATTQNQTRS